MDDGDYLIIMWILSLPMLAVDIIFDYKTYFSIGWVVGMMITTFYITRIELCVILNTFNSYVGGIAENTFFQVSGIFSQMFPVMFGIGCFIIGYGLRGLKPFVFHYVEG